MSFRIRSGWVYLLPMIHLGVSSGCYVLTLVPGLNFTEFLWTLILALDLPVSLPTYLIGRRYPGIAVAWIILVGTLWWYLLGRIGESFFRLFTGGEAVPSIYVRERLATGSSVASSKRPAEKRL
jgi:hypothetical protein